ncbi:MAG: response regulator, partial [Myxococcales bacterium]|nr:response regulator [Myxococcales bacterium]
AAVAQGITEQHVMSGFFFLSTLVTAMGLQVVHRYRTALDGFRARRRLEELDRQKTHFFQNISHELRTPLTLILHPLASLAERHPGQEVDMARRNALRLLRLVNQLLDFQKITQGHGELHPEPVAMAGFLRQLVDMGTPAASAQHIDLELDVRGDAVAHADPDALEKALFNYLANALKFTPEGGRVTVRMAVGGDRVRVEVDDSGPGVAPEDIPRLFRIFAQLDSGDARQAEGTGLGLALTRELVEGMGGAVGVERSPDGGARFWLEVPADASVTASRDVLLHTSSWALPAQREAAVVADPRNTSGRTVLLVDDLPDMRTVLAGMLADVGHRVLQASGGEEALEIATETPPDLLISDWMMPGMSGLELLTTWRAEPDLASVPVVVLTARGDDGSRVDGLLHGADAFVSKPFERRELLAVVHNLLALKDRERELAIANRALAEARENAEAASRAKSAFLASMSHELRTPLNAILGYAELLHEELDDDALTEDVGRIEQAGHHLLTLIDDVLDLSKVAQGQLTVHPEVFDVVALVREVAPLAAGLAARNRNALRVEDDTPAWVRADRTRVRQIVLNLLSNAVKFTEDGTIDVTFARGSEVTIEVRDTGIGMDDEQLASAFRPFVQVHRQDHVRYGGTGLGLAVSRQLAVLMQGSLDATSAPGRGSTLTLRLRAAAAPVEEALEAVG